MFKLLSWLELGEQEQVTWGGFLDGVIREGSKTGDVQEQG